MRYRLLLDTTTCDLSQGLADSIEDAIIQPRMQVYVKHEKMIRSLFCIKCYNPQPRSLLSKQKDRGACLIITLTEGTGKRPGDECGLLEKGRPEKGQGDGSPAFG